MLLRFDRLSMETPTSLDAETTTRSVRGASGAGRSCSSSSVVGSACTFFTLWLLAHHLSAEAFGRYTFYLAVFMLLDTLADFGTGQIAVQRTAHDEAAIPRCWRRRGASASRWGFSASSSSAAERSSSASTARCGSCSRACTR